MNLYFKPRISPLDAVDAVIALLVMMLQLALYFFLPAAIAYCLTYLITGAAAPSVGAAFGAVVGIALTAAAYTVWGAEVTEEGLRFRRLVGEPKFVPWSQVTGIAAAPREDVILEGWLRPLFTGREMTASFSSKNHFLITWKGGSYFYPPEDSAGFEQAVKSHLPAAA